MRSAFVAKFAEVRPDRAVAAWPGHPDAELWSGLTGIAAAARAGHAVSPAIVATLMDAARKAPLAAEPFLVRGVQARLAGNESLAGEAFLAAELRNGRSVPARYFLADHDLRSGDAVDGLRQISVLARMIPNGVRALAPFVASYATDRRNWAQLRHLFRSDPSLGDAALTELAADPHNADLVLRLAPPSPGLWQGRLVGTLVAAGDYDKAYQAWRRVTNASGPPGALIYDPGFIDAKAPGPFNWTLASSSLGLAERRGGRLHVIYYGQDDGVLASQLLLLTPGRYRLGMQASGDVANAVLLSWTITCADSGSKLLTLAVAPRAQGSFTVPSGCAAQRLELAGTAPELSRSVDMTIGGLSIARERAGG